MSTLAKYINIVKNINKIIEENSKLQEELLEDVSLSDDELEEKITYFNIENNKIKTISNNLFILLLINGFGCKRTVQNGEVCYCIEYENEKLFCSSNVLKQELGGEYNNIIKKATAVKKNPFIEKEEEPKQKLNNKITISSLPEEKNEDFVIGDIDDIDNVVDMQKQTKKTNDKIIEDIATQIFIDDKKTDKAKNFKSIDLINDIEDIDDIDDIKDVENIEDIEDIDDFEDDIIIDNSKKQANNKESKIETKIDSSNKKIDNKNGDVDDIGNIYNVDNIDDIEDDIEDIDDFDDIDNIYNTDDINSIDDIDDINDIDDIGDVKDFDDIDSVDDFSDTINIKNNITADNAANKIKNDKKSKNEEKVNKKKYDTEDELDYEIDLDLGDDLQEDTQQNEQKEIIKLVNNKSQDTLCKFCKSKIENHTTICPKCGADLTKTSFSESDLREIDEAEEFDEDDIKNILQEIKAEIEEKDRKQREKEAAEEEARRAAEKNKKIEIDISKAPKDYWNPNTNAVKMYNPQTSDPIKYKSELIYDVHTIELLDPIDYQEEEFDDEFIENASDKMLRIEEAEALKKRAEEIALVKQQRKTRVVKIFVFPLSAPTNGNALTADAAVCIFENGRTGKFVTDATQVRSLVAKCPIHSFIIRSEWRGGEFRSHVIPTEKTMTDKCILKSTCEHIMAADIKKAQIGHPVLFIEEKFVKGLNTAEVLVETLKIHALPLSLENSENGYTDTLYIAEDVNTKEREIYIGNDKNDRQINLLFQENVYTIWSCWKDEETFEANVVKAN